MLLLNGTQTVTELRSRGQYADKPSVNLAIFFIENDNPQSRQYVALKRKRAQAYGVNAEVVYIEPTVALEEVKERITALNHDDAIHGCIIQLPLPDHLKGENILGLIDPSKDVDDLTGESQFVSPMVRAVLALKEEYGLDFQGKKLCVLGYGRLVGKPISKWLTRANLPHDVVDVHTPNPDEIIRDSDVIFAGTGKKNIVHAGNTSEGQIIFDCSGLDVDFEAVKEKCAAITPPKGGIGPLTVHFLFENTLEAARN